MGTARLLLVAVVFALALDTPFLSGPPIADAGGVPATAPAVRLLISTPPIPAANANLVGGTGGASVIDWACTVLNFSSVETTVKIEILDRSGTLLSPSACQHATIQPFSMTWCSASSAITVDSAYCTIEIGPTDAVRAALSRGPGGDATADHDPVAFENGLTISGGSVFDPGLSLGAH